MLAWCVWILTWSTQQWHLSRCQANIKTPRVTSTGPKILWKQSKLISRALWLSEDVSCLPWRSNSWDFQLIYHPRQLSVCLQLLGTFACVASSCSLPESSGKSKIAHPRLVTAKVNTGLFVAQLFFDRVSRKQQRKQSICLEVWLLGMLLSLEFPFAGEALQMQYPCLTTSRTRAVSTCAPAESSSSAIALEWWDP